MAKEEAREPGSSFLIRTGWQMHANNNAVFNFEKGGRFLRKKSRRRQTKKISYKLYVSSNQEEPIQCPPRRGESRILYISYLLSLSLFLFVYCKKEANNNNLIWKRSKRSTRSAPRRRRRHRQARRHADRVATAANAGTRNESTGVAQGTARHGTAEMGQGSGRAE